MMYYYVCWWLLLKTTTILYKTNIGRPTSSVSVIIKRYETDRTSYEKERRQQIVFFDGQQWSLCVYVCVWRLLFFSFLFWRLYLYIEADGERAVNGRAAQVIAIAQQQFRTFSFLIFCLTHRQTDRATRRSTTTTKQLKNTRLFVLLCFVFKKGEFLIGNKTRFWI
jgi:cyanate permease